MRKLLSILSLLTLLFTLVTPAFAFEGEVTPSGLSLTEMEEQIEAFMSEYIGTSIPGAAIAVVHEGEIIFSRGYGYADVENQIPVDPAVTVFEYGSITKTFVWVAVMQLVERGLLDLDADVHTYLPDSFIFEKPFTMRDLLNHSAGFEDFLIGMFLDTQTVKNPVSLEETLLALQPRQIFTPGMLSAYSNYGTALAAFVVESVSRQEYTAFERENILFPLNMQNTLNQPDWFENDAFLANKAKGYNADGEGGFHEGMWTYIPAYPAGAINGTAEDLAAFLIALMPPSGEQSPLFAYIDTLEALFTPSSSDPINYPGTHHGFLYYPGILPALGHSGGTATFRTDFALVPESRFGFVLLTNNSWLDFNFLPAIHELLLGNPQTPTAGSSLPSAETVEGQFFAARRYGKFTEFFTYVGLANVSMIQVSALDENRIELSAGVLGSAVYVQTEPYVYHIYDSSDGLLIASWIPQMRFALEDGLPVRIHVGNGSDFTSLPAGRTMPFLIASLVMVALSGAFLVITPTVLLVLIFIRRKNPKKRTRFDLFSIGLLLSGTLFVFNNSLLFARFGINPFFEASVVVPQIWLNYVLTALMMLFFIGSLWSWRTAGETRKKSKVLFVLSAVFTIMFVVVLHNWQFFVLF
jgi:CubicO group peptidase (beta-lactamase class C family)